MTLPQLFHALIHALTTQPESHRVDRLLADLATKAAAQLHAAAATSLKLACFQVHHPEPVMAADRLLRHYGYALTGKRHHTAHLITITRHPATNSTDLDGRVRVSTLTKGAQAA